MPNGEKFVDVVVGGTGATADIKIWRSRREEWNPEQKFQGEKAYVGKLLIDTLHKKTRSKDIRDAQKKGFFRSYCAKMLIKGLEKGLK